MLAAAVPLRARGAVRVDPSLHVLDLGDRQRIVLFVSEKPSGAMVVRDPSGEIEVAIPDASIAPGVEPGAPSAPSGKGVRLDRRGSDVLVRIRPEGPVARVEARRLPSPPRVVVDLLRPQAAAAASPRRGARRGEGHAAAETARARSRERAPAAPSGARTEVDRATGAGASMGSRSEPATQGAVGPGVDAPGASGTAQRPRDGGRAEVAAADAAAPAAPAPPAEERRTAAGEDAAPELGLSRAEEPKETSVSQPVGEGDPEDPDSPRPRPSPSIGASGESAADEEEAEGHEADPAPGARGFVCAWRRVSGVPFCAPDPTAPFYSERRDDRALAARLARLPETVLPSEVRTIGANPYLQADVELVRRARSGHLWGAVRAYEAALRLRPGFGDADRARVNRALLLRELGFAPELRVAARSGSGIAAEVAAALLGDLEREAGHASVARDLYRRARRAGGLARCLARRGEAALALAGGDAAGARGALASLERACPPALLGDVETEWVRARLWRAEGDAARAKEALERIVNEVPRGRAGELRLELAAVAEQTGDQDRAVELLEELSRGTYGRTAARRAAAELARLDLGRGGLEAAIKRLETLEPAEASVETDEVLRAALRRALERHDAVEVLGLALGSHLELEELSVEERVGVARSYREVGLPSEALEVLDRLEARHRGRLPPGFWEERGELALASGNPWGAVALADEADRLRGEPSPASLSLRARALLAAGETAPAIRIVEGPLARIAPRKARALAAELALRLRTRAPGTARSLARSALPEEAKKGDEVAAKAARALALASAATGEIRDAVDAWLRLADLSADPVEAAEAAYRAAILAERIGADEQAREGYRFARAGKDPLTSRLAAAALAHRAILASARAAAAAEEGAKQP